MYKIMIVEDDNIIAAGIAKQIKAWGYCAVLTEDFHEVLNEFAQCSPQLVIMDIGLPFFNGFHWCSEIRKVSKVPIIFLSSAADNMNMVMAMNMDADDFISKPFDVQVLIAKIQALLRRTYDFDSVANLTQCGGAVLNSDDATITYNDNKTELTKT